VGATNTQRLHMVLQGAVQGVGFHPTNRSHGTEIRSREAIPGLPSVSAQYSEPPTSFAK